MDSRRSGPYGQPFRLEPIDVVLVILQTRRFSQGENVVYSGALDTDEEESMVGIDKLLSLICDFTSERSREVFQDGYGADSQAIKDIIYDVNFQIAKEEGGYLAEQNIPNRLSMTE